MEKQQEYYQANKNRILNNNKNYYLRNREKILAKQREKYNTPEGQEKEKLKTEKYKKRRTEINTARTENYRERRKGLDKTQRLKKYNINLSDYNNMLMVQNNKCAICGVAENLCVDHCHTTTKVRGLLCRKCNSLLGFAEDKSETLLSAIKYLENSRSGEGNSSPLPSC